MTDVSLTHKNLKSVKKELTQFSATNRRFVVVTWTQEYVVSSNF